MAFQDSKGFAYSSAEARDRAESNRRAAETFASFSHANGIHPKSPQILPYRSLMEYSPGRTDWFLQPYIPRGALTLVVGEAAVGKSSFIAWLLSQATSALFFPGFEENFGVQTLPRLRVYPTAGDNINVFEGPDWKFPDCKTRLIRHASALRADLIVFDPISSYLVDGASENDGAFVRQALEAAAEVAAAVNAAVVGARHPGKSAGNVMVGSREWRNVPRSIVQLLVDLGPPVRRMIRLFKDSLGQGESVREYHLDGEPGSPLTFRLGEKVEAEEANVASKLADDIDRSRFRQAKELLQRLLAEEEQESAYVYGQGEKEKISDRTMHRAAQALGIVMRREGAGKNHKCYWSLPAVPGGVSHSEGGSEPAGVKTAEKPPESQQDSLPPTDSRPVSETPPPCDTAATAKPGADTPRPKRKRTRKRAQTAEE